MIPNSQENMGSVDLFELKIMLASTENPELIKKILKLIKKISERKDEEQLKKSIDIFAEGIQVKQIGQPLKPKPETSKRKTKVRVAVIVSSKLTNSFAVCALVTSPGPY
jgi:hypothetical protein